MMKKRIKKKIPWAKLFGWILFISLLGSILFSAYMIATTPATDGTAEVGERLKSDYVLMLCQCVGALVFMFFPSILHKKFKLDIPHYMYALFFIFLFCAVYLGEVRNFFFVIPNWDMILHFFSGAMLGALGFTLVTLLNNEERVRIQLSPLFVCLFAFCFAIAIGAIWEIYEFVMDGLLGMNMQKFRLEDGTLLIGREALRDTMEDLITDASAALLVTVIGALTMKKRKKTASEGKEQDENTDMRG